MLRHKQRLKRCNSCKNRCFEGEQRIYQFDSQLLKGSTKFGVYLSPAALEGKPCSTLFYLAGLTCTEETFAIKAHAQHMAAQLSLILITPDTSPRGEQVAVGDNWDLGQGAGFYINATQAPWSEHYQMESYLIDELYPLILKVFQSMLNKSVFLDIRWGTWRLNFSF